MLDRLASLAGGWLGSVASALASGKGLLCVVALIVIAWLARTAGRTLADRVGVRLGPLLAVLVIAAAWLSLRLGSPAPPPGGPSHAEAAREAQERRALRQSNAEAAQVLDRMMWTGQ